MHLENFYRNSGNCLGEISVDELCNIASRSTLMQSPYSNFLFSHSPQSTLLFVNGISYEVGKPFAELVCKDEHIDFQQLRKTLSSSDKKP